jgi:hypothetical protein
MTRASKTKYYTSLFYRSRVGTIFHRNVDWGHANLELLVFTMQLLLLSFVFNLSEQWWGENSRG